jgi:KaiC/GvpD/RAD55 family RecA-like ATPase
MELKSNAYNDDFEDDDRELNLQLMTMMKEPDQAEGFDNEVEVPFNYENEVARLTSNKKDMGEALENDIWLINCAIADPEIAEYVCAANLITVDALQRMANIARNMHREGRTPESIRETIGANPCFETTFKEILKNDKITSDDKMIFKEFYYREINESVLKDVVEFAARNNYGYKPSSILKMLSKYYPEEISLPSEIASMRSVEDARAWMKSFSQRQIKRVKTSSLQLNMYTNGGLKPGCLYGFAGGTGVGKTIILCWLCADLIRNGYAVLYVSTEMLKEELFSRINRSATITKTNEAAELKYELLLENVGFKGYDVWCAEELRSTVEDIEDKARDGNYDVIIVDYGDKLSAGCKTDNEYARQGVVFSKLSSLAKKLDIPILVATQQNREAFKNPDGGMETVGDSIDKIKPLEMLFTIPYYDPKKYPERRNQKNLVIKKNRDGVRDVEIFFDIEYQSWSLSEPEYVKTAIEKNTGINPQDLYYRILDEQKSIKKAKVNITDESDDRND